MRTSIEQCANLADNVSLFPSCSRAVYLGRLPRSPSGSRAPPMVLESRDQRVVASALTAAAKSAGDWSAVNSV
jgi:hypothetical protein